MFGCRTLTLAGACMRYAGFTNLRLPPDGGAKDNHRGYVLADSSAPLRSRDLQACL